MNPVQIWNKWWRQKRCNKWSASQILYVCVYNIQAKHYNKFKYFSCFIVWWKWRSRSPKQCWNNTCFSRCSTAFRLICRSTGCSAQPWSWTQHRGGRATDSELKQQLCPEHRRPRCQVRPAPCFRAHQRPFKGPSVHIWQRISGRWLSVYGWRRLSSSTSPSALGGQRRSVFFNSDGVRRGQAAN